MVTLMDLPIAPLYSGEDLLVYAVSQTRVFSVICTVSGTSK